MCHAFRRAIGRDIAEAMPVGIIEIDEIDGRDAGTVEREMIVLHVRAPFVAEYRALELGGNFPQVFHELKCLSQRMLLDRNAHVFAIISSSTAPR